MIIGDSSAAKLKHTDERSTYWDDNDASPICRRSPGPGGVAAASVRTQQAHTHSNTETMK